MSIAALIGGKPERNLGALSLRLQMGVMLDFRSILRAKLREEIHFHSGGQACSGAEGDVHVLMKNFSYIRTRDLHASGKFRLGNAQLFHTEENTSQKRRYDSINYFHEDDK